MSAAAAVLALAGAALFAGPAQAAATATITLPEGDIAFNEDPLRVAGECVDGSRTAVVSVTQGTTVLDQVSANLAADLRYTADLDISGGGDDMAVASVDCFAYPDADPLGSAETELLIVTVPDFEEIEVTVSPKRVAIGSSYTITGRCPAGTEVATVLAGRIGDVPDSQEAFLEEQVTPAADGTVTLTSVLKAGPAVSVGDAAALVVCGSDEDATALGFAEFTIVRAVAPASPRPAPELADTGADNGPLAAMGLGLLVLGMGAHGARRLTNR